MLTDPEVLCGGRRLGWEKLGCGFYIYGDLTVELVCWVGEFTVACSFWVNLNGLPNGGMRYESNQKLELCIFFWHFLYEPSLSLSSSFSWFSPKSFAYYLTFFGWLIHSLIMIDTNKYLQFSWLWTIDAAPSSSSQKKNQRN